MFWEKTKMAIFSKKQVWEPSFRVSSRAGAGRGFLTVLFWLWGGFGLLSNLFFLVSLGPSVGVGSSSFLSATSLVWIGGMVLFGLGALLANNSLDGERPASADLNLQPAE